MVVPGFLSAVSIVVSLRNTFITLSPPISVQQISFKNSVHFKSKGMGLKFLTQLFKRWIALVCFVDNSVGFLNTYPLDHSVLSRGG